jgi:hypothetical protein
MAEPSNAPRRALRASEALLLEYLREHADPDGCAVYTKAELETALGLARSTLALAVNGLRELGELTVDQSAGARANAYCVTPSDDRPIGPSDTVRFGPSDDRPTPSDSLSSDAPPHASAQPRRARAAPPPTPMVPPTATGVSDSLAQPPAPTREAEPSDADHPIPIGQLAVAAAAEAAKLAGRELDAAVRGRLGRAAQKVAGEHSIDEVLDAARRIGEGAGDDLYTDLQRRADASRQGRDPLRLGRLKPGEIVEAEALYVGTYGERRRFDGELWARELASFPIGAILWGIRAMAKASPHPPTWGEVAAAAGPTLEHERRKRQNRLAVQREDERIEARG